MRAHGLHASHAPDGGNVGVTGLACLVVGARVTACPMRAKRERERAVNSDYMALKPTVRRNGTSQGFIGPGEPASVGQ